VDIARGGRTRLRDSRRGGGHRADNELETAFHISNAQLGLLAAISTFVGAVATVPMGALSDRVCRVNLLAISVFLWAVAMGACALAQTYGSLLLARLGLGAVTATAGPAIASLMRGCSSAPSATSRPAHFSRPPCCWGLCRWCCRYWWPRARPSRKRS
jgi:MFS family permease